MLLEGCESSTFLAKIRSEYLRYCCESGQMSATQECHSESAGHDTPPCQTICSALYWKYHQYLPI